ncbi:MAG: peptide chain release factor N(5)-glutamine methyltransferase [Nitrospirae bacterium]|nr:peptide chain release factor N(5)-glutamine methyltransferase [Nitrospirota bacterium]
MPPSVLDVLRKSAAYLAAKGVPEARLDAELLVARALNCDRLALYLAFDRPLAETELAACRAAIRRRARREPVQHILGDQAFRALTLEVTADTLVPRPETEEVVDHVLAEVDRLMTAGVAAPALLDLGTGSGCIALAVATERPAARVTAVDQSAAALAVARRNAVRAGASVRFLQGDWYAPLEAAERFHLIVSNPPYLTPVEWEAAQPEVRDFEPRAALVGGDDGLDAYRHILEDAPARLHPGGGVVVEIGHTQGEAVAAIARRAGFDDVRRERDMEGRERAVIARGAVRGG